jgi:hypothetical protein
MELYSSFLKYLLVVLFANSLNGDQANEVYQFIFFAHCQKLFLLKLALIFAQGL